MSGLFNELAALREQESGLLAAVATAEHSVRANAAKLAKLKQQHDKVRAQRLAAATAAALGEQEGENVPSRGELEELAMLIAGCESAHATLTRRTTEAKIRLADHEKEIKRLMRQALDVDIRSSALDEWNVAWDQVLRAAMKLISIDRLLFTEADDNRFSPSPFRITGSPTASLLDELRTAPWDKSSYAMRPRCFPKNTAFDPFKVPSYLESVESIRKLLTNSEED